jgi:hypothetical protein
MLRIGGDRSGSGSYLLQQFSLSGQFGDQQLDLLLLLIELGSQSGDFRRVRCAGRVVGGRRCRICRPSRGEQHRGRTQDDENLLLSD